MDIVDLRVFIAVAEQRGFSQASHVLHLTQSAVSKRIAGLEDELGQRLFDRISRHVDLTPAGHALLPRARHILLEIQDSVRQLANLDQQISGPLSLATSHHIGLHRLPPVLRQFTADYPTVELDLHFMDSEQACQAVEQGDIELAIVTLPTHASPLLETETLWHDRLVVVISPERLPTTTPFDWQACLQQTPTILPSTGTYTREIIAPLLARLGVEDHRGMATNYLETIKMLVSVGLGWSILPHTLVDDSLTVVAVPDMSLHRELGRVQHRQRTASNAAKAFCRVLQGFADPATA
ncbi:MAG: LysR family transcriptional regulator [Nitrospira sp.]|nr:LysR family transcriptional regulator [Nitrospira sp.]